MTRQPPPVSSKPRPLLRGDQISADYRIPELTGWRDNPMIAALPPVRSPQQVEEMLRRFPPISEDDAHQPDYVRIHAVRSVQRMFQPLNRHLELEQKITGALRDGYIGRNPLDLDYWSNVDRRLSLLEQADGSWREFDLAATTGLALVGISGVGKSTTLARILLRSPQVIVHTSWRGTALPISQLVWLKIDCPWNRAARGWCIAFFEAVDAVLGTDYRNSYKYRARKTHDPSADDMLPEVIRVAAAHCLGLLVIDEIQNLRPGDDLVRFFVQLNNTLGVPLLKVGTYKARRVLAGAFHEARRNSGQGDLEWDPLEQESPEWRALLGAVWQYYYLPEPIAIDGPVAHKLYELMRGIPDFTVKLWALAQARAILNGEPCITTEALEQVFKDSFRLARPALEALRYGRAHRGKIFDELGDIDLVDIEPALEAAAKELAKHAVLAPAPTPRASEAPSPANRRKSRKVTKRRPRLAAEDLRALPDHAAISGVGLTEDFAEESVGAS